MICISPSAVGRWLLETLTADENATAQFEIADQRSPAEIAEVLRRHGFEAVWKDWDQAILAGA